MSVACAGSSAIDYGEKKFMGLGDAQSKMRLLHTNRAVRVREDRRSSGLHWSSDRHFGAKVNFEFRCGFLGGTQSVIWGSECGGDLLR